MLAAPAKGMRARIDSEDAQRELERTQELFERVSIATEELAHTEPGNRRPGPEEEFATAARVLAAVALECCE